MKIREMVCVALVLCVAGVARAAENKYDLLGKVLMPFVHLCAPESSVDHRAVTMVARLESMTDLPPEWTGARAEIALQYPDKLRVFAPVLGEPLTICRNGQELWVHPGSAAQALFDAAAAKKKLPRAEKNVRLQPFRLPVPKKQLVFLPVLFKVNDAGSEIVESEKCRVLDLTLMPELARSLDATGWSARLWATPRARPVRLRVQREDWNVTVVFESVQFAASLPPATWRPTAEQSSDVWKIPPGKYQQLLKLLGGGARR